MLQGLLDHMMWFSYGTKVSKNPLEKFNSLTKSNFAGLCPVRWFDIPREENKQFVQKNRNHHRQQRERAKGASACALVILKHLMGLKPVFS